MHVNNNTTHSIILYGGSSTINCRINANSTVVNVVRYQSVRFYTSVNGSTHNTVIPYPATFDIRNIIIDIGYANGSFTFAFH